MSSAFEELYIEPISLAKKNKELKFKVVVVTKENELKETNTNLKRRHEQSKG